MINPNGDKIRKYIILTKPLDEALTREAARRGVSVSRLLRHIVTEWMSKNALGAALEDDKEGDA